MPYLCSRLQNKKDCEGMKKIVFLITCFCLVVLGLEPAMAETIRYWQVNVGVGQGSGSVYAEIYKAPVIGNVSKTQTTVTTTSAMVSVQDEASASFQSSIAKRYGKFYATPADGYEFAGWYTDPECTTGLQTDNPYQTESVIRDDREVCTWTYYAKFTPIVTTYYSQARAYVPSEGATGVYVTVNDHTKTTYESIDSKNQWVTSGEDHTANPKALTTVSGHMYYFYAKPKTGYTHIGWSTTDGGEVIAGSAPDENTCWVLNATVTQSGTTSSNPQWFAYYPVFKANYSISFDANGGTGTMATQTLDMADTYTLPANGFTAPTYTVSFDGNGGGSVASVSKQMSFNGWEDHGSIVFNNTTYDYTSFDAPYYANTYSDIKAAFGYNKYKLIEHYVNYGSGEGRSAKGAVLGAYPVGAGVSCLTTTAGYTVPLYAQWTGTITLPNAPTAPAGSYFTGWYDGDTKVGNAGDSYTVTGNITLTAHWGNTYTLTIYNNGHGTIAGSESKVLTMTYGSTDNNSVNPSEWNYAPKFHYGKVMAAISDGTTYYELFDSLGHAVCDGRFFDAEGRWIYASDLGATTVWAGNVTMVTLEAAPGGFKGTTAQQGEIELIQESAQHFSDGVLNPYYPGYVFTGGYTGQNGTGYRVYRDGSRATTDGGYWKDSGRKTETEPIIPILLWDRGDLAALTLYAHWVEAYFYFEVADGAWETQGCWREYDAGVDETGLLEGHQNADTLPQSFNNVIVSKTMRINTEVSCYSLTIVEGGSVTIAPTGGLSVGEGGVTGATTDNFIIESTTEHQGYFRMSPSATTPMPTATVLFATRSTLDTGADRDATWQYFGVPCSTTMAIDGNTWLNEWSTASGWVSKAQGQNHTLSTWRGYCITQYGQPTYEFAGKLLNGNQTISLTGTEATQGMNQIANSYSAPIDVTKFTAEDFGGDLIQTFYIYNAGSWNQWNANKGTTPSAAGHTPGTYTAIPVLSSPYLASEQTLIAPMQAIMIQLTDASATVSFNYAKHVWAAEANGGSTMTDPVLAPTRTNHPSSITNHQSLQRVRLSVGSANSGVDHLYLLGREDWTADYDNGYDAPKMATRGLANIYTTISEGMLAVDARSCLDSIYVGFAAGSDTDYTLCFSALLGEQYDLIDLYNYTRVTMTEGAEYSFTAEPNAVNNQRFLVVRTAEQPGVATELPSVQPAAEGPAMVYTFTGQYVGTHVPSAKGVYIVLQGQTVTKIAQQ